MMGDHFIRHSILLVSFFTGDQDGNLEVVFIFTEVGASEESNDVVVKYMQHTLTH
jgi:hypothetical protein